MFPLPSPPLLSSVSSFLDDEQETFLFKGEYFEPKIRVKNGSHTLGPKVNACLSKVHQSEKEIRTNNYAPFRGFKQSPNLTIETWNFI